MGDFTIPNTKIKLINFSLYPTCNKIFSFAIDGSNFRENDVLFGVWRYN